MRQFDYNKYLKNNPLLKEAKQSRLIESSDPLDTMQEAPKEVEEAQSAESTDDYVYFVQKGLKKGEFAHITPKTKVVVGNQVVTKYNGMFGEIVKIVGDKYIIADDAWGDKSQNSRKNLEKYYLLVIK